MHLWGNATPGVWRTKPVLGNGLDPRFEETFRIDVKDVDHAVLGLRVQHSDQLRTRDIGASLLASLGHEDVRFCANSI